MKRKLKNLLIVMCTAIIIFNFICPNYIYADTDETASSVESSNDEDSFGDEFLPTGIFDGILGIFSYLYRIPAMLLALGIQGLSAAVAKMGGVKDGTETIILLTPDDILFNKLYITDINFFDFDLPTSGLNNASAVLTIRQQVSLWYYVMRVIAISILLCILIYVGIRMALSTIASEKAVYKTMLVDWVVSLTLVFLLHYIIIATISVNESLVKVISSVLADGDPIKDGINSIKTQAFGLSAVKGTAAVVIYFVIITQTLAFLISYVKRMLTLAFLIIISPLITITYSIDRIGDGKSQALNSWLKEFIYNILLQPFHCILYAAFVTAAADICKTGSLAGMILAMLCIKFVWDGENIVRKIFGFDKAGTVANAAASAAVAMTAVNAMKSAGKTAAGAGLKYARKTETGKKIGEKFSNFKKDRLDKVKSKTRAKIDEKAVGEGGKFKNGWDQTKLDAAKAKSDAYLDKSGAIGRLPGIRSLGMKNNERREKSAKLREKRKTDGKETKRDKMWEKISNSSVAKDASMMGKKFTRTLTKPGNVVGVAAGLAAMGLAYGGEKTNLMTAGMTGFATAKVVSSKINEVQKTKSQNYEGDTKETVQACNKLADNPLTEEKMRQLLESFFRKGKNGDYDNKNMNNSRNNFTNSVKSELGSGGASQAALNLQRMVLENPNGAELAKEIEKYKSSNNDDALNYITDLIGKNHYDNSEKYDTMMEPYGVDHDDAISSMNIDKIFSDLMNNQNSDGITQVTIENNQTEIIEQNKEINVDVTNEVHVEGSGNKRNRSNEADTEEITKNMFNPDDIDG